eukprot:TRINITY_DN13607_c0_g1_i2.p1 TRINITY_DN13607_c0_g1~~TRINITY_DN13607_c0_g1_i2.p1  ORF type:complete len:170 (-),score=37.22 TRINITY_DN13607_c0_g1_i2:217-726(-)
MALGIVEARKGLTEALAVFLRRQARLRKRLQQGGNTWTGNKLGLLVEDCSFMAEPFGWIVDALVSYLEEPMSTGCVALSKYGIHNNWVTEAFDDLAQSSRPLTPQGMQIPPGNWIASAFEVPARSCLQALVGGTTLEVPGAQRAPRGCGDWMADALAAAAEAEDDDRPG